MAAIPADYLPRPPRHPILALAACTIDADREHVWRSLTDFDAYDAWHPLAYAVDRPNLNVGERRFERVIGASGAAS